MRRAGRWWAGVSGAQFALPEAVGRLRAVRSREAGGALLALSAADPLNLVGIVLPGERLPALATNRLLLRDGEALGAMIARQARIWVPLDASAMLEARRVLARRPGLAPASPAAGARPAATGSRR